MVMVCPAKTGAAPTAAKANKKHADSIAKVADAIKKHADSIAKVADAISSLRNENSLSG
jgi:hypothetical protein